MDGISWGTFVALGIVNWIATTIIVESELTAPLRAWIVNRRDQADERYVAGAMEGQPWAYLAWRKVAYLVGCHLCVGVWVALAEVSVGLFGVSIDGLAPLVGYTLLVKGIGHLILELRPQAWYRLVSVTQLGGK